MLSEYISSNESEPRIFRIRSNQQNASSKKKFGKKNKGYQQEPSVGVLVVLFKTPGHACKNVDSRPSICSIETLNEKK